MKAAQAIYVCVALLPLITCDYESLREQLDAMTTDNHSVNGIFQPAAGGYLGAGFYSITYKGKLLKPTIRHVAMKFSDRSDKAADEYDAYTYLDAIDNPEVERYGIPAVYYYGIWRSYYHGKWQNYSIMAITLLDSNIKIPIEPSIETTNEIDVLIIVREFVRISKYMHFRGVHHEDMKLENIMFRRHQGFIIDFNLADQLHKCDTDRVFGRKLAGIYEDRRPFAKDDWASFLCSICEYIGVNFEYFNRCSMSDLLRGGNGNIRSKLMGDVEKRINKINPNGIRRVFKELAKNAFRGEVDLWESEYKRKLPDLEDTTKFPNYDEVYQIINEEIEKLKLPKPVMVSWLKGEEREEAEKELESSPLPDISSIENKFENVHAPYPEVNYKHF